ncbi:MAG: aspartate aminotransferase family protein [Pseudomonadota bacterium]|nr:aspartate aminotransferase family protein [Pseudomonadota bacterium]
MAATAEQIADERPLGKQVRDDLIARTPRSHQINREGSKVLAVEVVPTFEMRHPIYIEKTAGSRVNDVDGNSYIDLTMGMGPHLLGHRPACVVEAMHEQLERNIHVSLHNPLQKDLANLVKDAARCAEQVIFCNSGTEATMYGMRVARGFTDKPKVASFSGSYHGAHDYALVKDDSKSPPSAPTGKAYGRGVPDVINNDTMMVLPYRDERAFDLIREHAHELAVVIIEPVQSSNPRTDAGDFLHGLNDVCRECGVLFMFDEVITGFRIAYGGAQEYFDITPDLATYGKAMGGGMPIGALAGRADAMALLGKGWGHPDGVFSGGTFSGNPMTMAAGIAALEYMRDNQQTLYPHLNRQGDRLAAEVNTFCEDHQIPAQLMNAGSMFLFQFQRGAIERARDVAGDHHDAENDFYLHVLGRGVIVPPLHLFFISEAHSAADVDTIIAAFQDSLLDVRADGLL